MSAADKCFTPETVIGFSFKNAPLPLIREGERNESIFIDTRKGEINGKDWSFFNYK